VIIGAQKAGTTWLRRQLQVHSRIFMPKEELHFFDDPQRYEEGIAAYARHFKEALDGYVVGEKTPDYLYLGERTDIPDGVGRMHRFLPHAKLIAIFRDPVTRAESAVNHLIHQYGISPVCSVDDLLLGRKRERLPWPVVEMGIYGRQLEPFLDLFGPSAIQTLFYEDDVIGDPQGTVNQVLDFLGLSHETHARELRMRTNRPRRSRFGLAVNHYAPFLSGLAGSFESVLPDYYPRLSEAGRETLHHFYEPHNEELFALLGKRPRSGWRFGSEPRIPETS
jgi:hypothetical protein